LFAELACALSARLVQYLGHAAAQKCRIRVVLRHNRRVAWQTRQLGAAYDRLAPDGTEIRDLVRVSGGSMVHCTLRPGQTTQAVRHRTVEETWFCLAGRGQVWRRAVAAPPTSDQSSDQGDEVVEVEPGVALTIPLGVAFQFRASGSQPLELVIATMPPWPGHDEAVPMDGLWEHSR
jgi:mannose-6-phosphate isomerase-like protein (cupin superfamily)